MPISFRGTGTGVLCHNSFCQNILTCPYHFVALVQACYIIVPSAKIYLHVLFYVWETINYSDEGTMTGEAWTKSRWPGGLSAVMMTYSPGRMAKWVLVGMIEAMLANEDRNNGHHRPRRSCATPSYVGIRVTGARVLRRVWCICKPLPGRTVHDAHHVSEQKSKLGMHRRQHGLKTPNTHDDNNTTHAPHA